MADKKQDDKSKPKTVEVTITNGACELLKVILIQPGWYKEKAIKTPLNAYEVAEALSDTKAPEDEDAAEEWANEERKIDVSLDQFDAVKVCVQEHLKNGALVLTKHVAALIKEFEVE